ncbi:MAG: LuxR family transcriptional regulator [Chitinophagaceae bacterium]|nr:LuxR family transcriptional regulator [Chitinophagaceae bacterium]
MLNHFKLLFFSFFICCCIYSQGYHLEGKILRSADQYKVSLYVMRNINSFYCMGLQDLANSTLTREDGSFTLSGRMLPVSGAIYRIQVKQILNKDDKLNDLLATNILSTDKMTDRNFLFFTLYDSSNISIEISVNGNLVSDYRFNKPAQEVNSFIKLDGLLKAYDSEVDKVGAEINQYATTYGAVSAVQENKKEKLELLKLRRKNLLEHFVEVYGDQQAAVLATFYLLESYGYEFSRIKRNYNSLSVGKGNAIYLPSLKKLFFKDEAIYQYKNGFYISALLNFLLAGAGLFVFFRRNKTKLSTDNNQSAFSLTRKEIEILEMVAMNLSNKEIAARQFLEISTIKKHITNIYGKTSINNRMEAKRYYEAHFGSQKVATTT